jgi:cytochrome P450
MERPLLAGRIGEGMPMPASGQDAPPFDLHDPQTLFVASEQDRLPDLYAQLAGQAPLWQLPGVEDVYLACTRELVEEAVARPEQFSSNMTRLLYRDGQGAPAVYELVGLDDPSHVLATADPPAHTAQRRLLQPLLSRRAVSAWTPRVAAIADELMDAWRQPAADVATELADPLTMRVACLMIGVPEDHAPELAEAVIATDRLICGLADRAGMDAGASAALTTGIRMAGYLDATPPPGSILSTLKSAIADGTLSESAAVGILLQLISAGTETTATLIAHAVRQLADDQAMQRRLRENPDGIPGFLEDVLRDDGPFQFHSRTTRPGATLGGTPLPADSLVLLMWASANHNPPVPAPADRTTPTAPASHLAFGRGIHFCIGAHLARMEAAVAIQGLLSRTSGFVSDPDRPPTSRPSLMMPRPSSMSIRWHPA